MKYAVEMGSGAMIYIPSFRKIGSGIQKLICGHSDTQTHRQRGDLISLLIFFQNKESRLRMNNSPLELGNMVSFSHVLFGYDSLIGSYSLYEMCPTFSHAFDVLITLICTKITI
jgi:hypothetical protein